MEFTVVGAGAIGGVIGASLAQLGRNVELVDIVQEHVEKINQAGLLIETQTNNSIIDVSAFTPNQLVEKSQTIDCLLLCVKAQYTREAIQSLLPLISKQTMVVSLQNGLCEWDIAELVGRERTIGGFVNIFSDYLAPGVIHYGGKGSITIGEWNGKYTSRLKQIEREMQGFDEVHISSNVFGFIWAKMAYGAMLTATALTNETIADIFGDLKYRTMLMNMASEVLEVAEAVGVKPVGFDDWNPNDAYPREHRDHDKMNDQLNRHVNRLRTYSKTHSGIWRDIAVRKRPTEKPHHFKPIFKLAEQHYIRMPLCSLLLRILREVETGQRILSTENLELLIAKNEAKYS